MGEISVSAGAIVAVLVIGFIFLPPSAPTLEKGPRDIDSFGGVSAEPVRVTSEPTTTPTQNTPTPSPTGNREAAELSSQQQSEIQSLFSGFYSKLGDADQQRRETTIQTAQQLCSSTQDFGNVSNAASAVAEGKESTRRLDFAVQIINENFNEQLSRSAISDLRGATNRASRFVPVVGSFNAMHSDACAVASDPTQEAIEDYYISTMSFGVEVGMAQVGFYRSAFRGTRYVANNANLAKLRTVCGDRCYALAMSEIHWALRAAPSQFVNYLRDKAREEGISIDIDDSMREYVVENQDVEYAREVVVSCSTQAGENVVDTAGDAASEGGDWLDSAKDAVDNADEIDWSDVEDAGESAIEAGQDAANSLADLDPEERVEAASNALKECADGS